MHFLVIKKKSILLTFILLVLLSTFAIKNNAKNASVVYFGYAPRLVPIYSVETEKKQVAISFDSAWGADKTESILNTLKEYNANATFFLVGFWTDKYPEMVKKIHEQGVEIGTHSNTHPDFTKISVESMKLELETSVKKIKDVVDVEVELFRPPFGAYNNNLINVSNDLGLKTIQWDVDTLDWKGISAMEITNRVLNQVKNGSIILCHNNADHIVEALPLILDRLQKQGYEIVSIGDLVYKDNYTIDHQGIQRKN